MQLRHVPGLCSTRTGVNSARVGCSKQLGTFLYIKIADIPPPPNQQHSKPTDKKVQNFNSQKYQR